MTALSNGRTRPAVDCCDIVHSQVVEDYLKAIFKLSSGDKAVRTTELAAHLGISAPTASAMLRRLQASDLIERTDDRPVRLSPHGQRHALGVVRRHRLIECFLSDVLGVPWDEVHDEAEVLEHAISPRLEARIDAFLGHPTRDPHGDPIPSSSGDHTEDWAAPLAGARAGDTFAVERVSDHDSGLLRHLAEMGVQPGSTLVVGEWSPFGGPLEVEIDGQRKALSPAVVAAVHGRSLR